MLLKDELWVAEFNHAIRILMESLQIAVSACAVKIWQNTIKNYETAKCLC